MIFPRFLFSFLTLVFLTSCENAPWGCTNIGVIVNAPSGFEGKQLKLKGTVKDVVKIPLVDMKMYKLNDGTGEITVTTQGSLPALGGKVTVSGKVENVAVLGSQAMGLHFLEYKRFE